MRYPTRLLQNLFRQTVLCKALAYVPETKNLEILNINFVTQTFKHLVITLQLAFKNLLYKTDN